MNEQLELAIPFGRRRIGVSEPVMIIAEIGINHEGDQDLCLRMIKDAADAGADAIKLQTVDADASYAPDTESYKTYSRASLSPEVTGQMFKAAQDLGMEAFTTSGDIRTLEWVDRLEPAAHKVSSGLMSHIPYLRAIAAMNHPALMSTGMSEGAEIDTAVEIIRDGRVPGFGLFQCTSLYPAASDTLNLRAIAWMRDRYHVPVGFSDHSEGIDAAALAVAAGARMVEKHFSFDVKRTGFDHHISLDKSQFAQMVVRVRDVETMLGPCGKSMTDEQAENAAKFSRYLVACRDIPQDHVLEPTDIEVMRVPPGHQGIVPSDFELLVGRRTLREISRFAAFSCDDLA